MTWEAVEYYENSFKIFGIPAKVRTGYTSPTETSFSAWAKWSLASYHTADSRVILRFLSRLKCQAKSYYNILTLYFIFVSKYIYFSVFLLEFPQLWAIKRASHNFRDCSCNLAKKLTLGLLATITLEVVPFRAYAPFPALLPFLNASWKSCWEDVQHRLRFCLSHLNFVKMAMSQFYLHSGKLRKVGWVREEESWFFYKKNSLVKEKCEVLSCHATATSLSQNVGANY
jgi:hypothetical protein